MDSSQDHDHVVSGGDGSLPVPSRAFAHSYLKAGRRFYIPLGKLSEPANGEVICNSWWLVHPEHGAAFYYQPFGYFRSEDPSPQCNAVESVTRRLNRDGLDVVQIPCAFLSHARKAMEQDKAALRDGASTR